MLTQNKHWQKADKDAVNDAVTFRIDGLKDDTDARYQKNLEHLSYYLNLRMEGFKPGELREIVDKKILNSKYPISFNAVSSVVDTLVARLSSQKVFPKVVVEDGKYEDRQTADDLEKFILGLFYSTNFYSEFRRVLFDCAIYGTGFLKVYADHDNRCVKIERVFPDEMIVDEQSYISSPPQEMFQVKVLPVDAIVDMFPDKEDAIRESARSCGIKANDTGVRTEMLELREAWYLASGNKKRPGRHCITIEGVDLLDEKWERSTFPFVVVKWTDKTVGFFGQGVVEQQKAAQNELNKVDGRIQDAHHMYATANTYFVEGSIDQRHLKNTSGNLIPVKAGYQVPTHISPPPMSSQVYDYRKQIYLGIFESSGVSQLSAAGVKPGGIESGIALRYLMDNETLRFSDKAQMRDESTIYASQLAIEAAKELNIAVDGGYKVRFVDKDWMKVVNFSEVDMDSEKYVIQTHPINLLPQLPAGKLATVSDMINMGLIDNPSDALALLDQPDIEGFKSDELAARDLVDKTIDLILKTGDAPDIPPFIDPNTILTRGTNAVLRARLYGADEDNVNALEDWIADAYSRMMPPPQPQMPEQQMPQQAPPAMPPGAPQQMP